MMKVFRHYATLCVVAFVVSGCAAATTAISKRELDVQTKMSDTVFLEPIGSSKKTVFVQIRNTSDKPDFDVSSEVKQAISAKGYRLMDDPDRAHYILQANILQVGKNSQTAAEKSLASGYGDTAAAVAIGAATGGYGFNSYGGGIAGALIGGVATTVANAAVKDSYYTAITDIQISERTKNGQKVVNRSKHNLQQGKSGGTISMTEEINDRKRYQTRILSSANKVNLKWEDAAPELVKGLVRSVSGIF